jgi:alpha-galactosidase
MKPARLLIAALILSPLAALPDVGQSKPVKVFILAGQSNMEGQSVVDLAGADYNDGRGTLVKLMADPTKAAMFQHLKAADGKWTVRDDVWVRYQREDQPLLAGPLGLGCQNSLEMSPC